LGMIGKISTEGVPGTFCHTWFSIFTLCLVEDAASTFDLQECREAGEIEDIANLRRNA
jgi:hypothetical protein